MEIESQEDTVKVGHVAEISPSSSEVDHLPGDTKVSFVPLDGFGKKGKIEYRETEELSEVVGRYTYFREGDIAIAKITPSFENGKGAVCSSLENGIGFGTTEIHVLRPSEHVTSEFLWYALRTKRFRDGAEAAMRGSAGQQRVPSEFIRNYEIPEYSISKQRQIVEYIEENLSRIEEVEEISESLISDSEAEIESVTSNSVTEGVSDQAHLVDSNVGWIGKIPERWDIVRTRFVAELHSGHTPSKSNDEYWENADIPWVSLADSDRIRHNDFISETEKYTNEKGLANSSAHLLPEGTVVFTRDATVGLCAIMEQPMAVSQHIVGWVCGPKILPEYLLNVLKSMDQEYDRLTRGSTISTIGMHDIESFKTPLPPLEEQREIVDHIETETERLCELIDRVEETIGLLEEKRQALITAAVTGQIDVSEA